MVGAGQVGIVNRRPRLGPPPPTYGPPPPTYGPPAHTGWGWSATPAPTTGWGWDSDSNDYNNNNEDAGNAGGYPDYDTGGGAAYGATASVAWLEQW